MRREVDIEELLRWTYQVQRAHVTDRSAVARTGWGPSMLAAAMERAALGCAIDGGGYAPAVTHPDADLVHEVVAGWCENSQLGMVVQHAIAGDRPDDGSGIRLRAKVDHVEMGPGRRPTVTWIRWVGTDSEVLFARTVYQHWWSAVSAIACEFMEDGGNARLRDHVVTGFAAAFEPWLDDCDENLTPCTRR